MRFRELTMKSQQRSLQVMPFDQGPTQLDAGIDADEQDYHAQMHDDGQATVTVST